MRSFGGWVLGDVIVVWIYIGPVLGVAGLGLYLLFWGGLGFLFFFWISFLLLLFFITVFMIWSILSLLLPLPFVLHLLFLPFVSCWFFFDGRRCFISLALWIFIALTPKQIIITQFFFIFFFLVELTPISKPISKLQSKCISILINKIPNTMIPLNFIFLH